MQDLAALGARLHAANDVATYDLQQELNIQASAGGHGTTPYSLAVPTLKGAVVQLRLGGSCLASCAGSK